MRSMMKAVTGLTVLMAMTTLALAEIPMLKKQVEAGKLPPMQERLPNTPLQLPFEGKTIGKYGGDLRLLMGKAKDIGQITVYTYARLVGYTPDLKLEADIVETYQVEEGRRFTFTLRESHKWSDGSPLTTEDFRYWWQDMVKHPELGRKGIPAEMLVNGEEPVFEILDERTFRYTWSKPNPEFLPALARPSPLYIYRPAEYMKRFHAEYANKDELDRLVEQASTKDWAGLHTRMQRQRRPENPDLPTLQAWQNTTLPPSTRYIFERNPFFHRTDPEGNQLPYVDRLIMTVVSKDVIPAKTGSGEADLQARYLRFDNVPFLKQGESKGGYRTLLWSEGRGSQVALFPNLNTTNTTWRDIVRDRRFRRALSMAIDREEINEVVYFGLASPSANTVMPQSALFKEKYANSWSVYEPQKANALLDELGLENRDSDGIRLLPNSERAEITIESAGESSEETDVLELIADHLKQVGIKVYVRTSQRDVFRSRAYSGETVISVAQGINNALAAPQMSPEELAPTDQPQLQWSSWGQHTATAGKAGEPADLEAAKQQLTNYKNWMAATTDEEREKAWQTMLNKYTDEVFSIGTVNNSRQPIVVNEALRNIPDEAVYAWEPTSYFGVYRPDTFWYDR